MHSFGKSGILGYGMEFQDRLQVTSCSCVNILFPAPDLWLMSSSACCLSLHHVKIGSQ